MIHFYKKFILSLNENRLLHQQAPSPAPSSAGSVELPPAATRNMTRTQAERVENRLKALTGDQRAGQLAAELHAANRASVIAENKAGKTKEDILEKTNALTAALLAGRSHLEGNTTAPAKTLAEEYAERALGIDTKSTAKVDADAARESVLQNDSVFRAKWEALKPSAQKPLQAIWNEAETAYNATDYVLAREKYNAYITALNQAHANQENLKTPDTPQAEASRAKREAAEKIASIIKENALETKDRKKLEEAGYKAMSTGDALYARGQYAEAATSYKAAKEAYAAFKPSKTEAATAAVEGATEVIDLKKVIAHLQLVLNKACVKHGMMEVGAGSVRPSAALIQALKNEYEKLKEPVKAAIGGSTIRYAALNPRNPENVMVLSETFNRSGDIDVKLDWVKRTERVSGALEFSSGEQEQYSKPYIATPEEAREKSPKECKEIVMDAIEAGKKNFKKRGRPLETDLKAMIEKSVSAALKKLTKKEKESINIDTKWEDVEGTTWDWRYRVRVQNGKLRVQAD